MLASITLWPAQDDNLHRIIEVLRRGEEVEYGFLGVTRPDFPRAKGIPVEELPDARHTRRRCELAPQRPHRPDQRSPGKHRSKDLLLHGLGMQASAAR